MTTYNISSKDVAVRIVALATALSLSACSGVMAGDTGDHLLLYGDVGAIRAWADHEAGLITNGKASNDAADTPFYGLRRAQSVRKALTPEQLRGEK